MVAEREQVQKWQCEKVSKFSNWRLKERQREFEESFDGREAFEHLVKWSPETRLLRVPV